jgi:beta-galactosidase
MMLMSLVRAASVSFGCAAAALSASAGLETATLPAPAPRPVEPFHLGTSQRPDGGTISVDPRSFQLDGSDWMPVMGEIHFSRYPESEWREELLKMKAGGIDIAATYVFWIHHEEVEGGWDWTGRRSLRGFVEAARDVGLKVIVRCGPWCHGEVRNGGVPDWAVQKFGPGLRTDDPAYLAHVRQIYGQIAGQLRGLLWKDGGPVIGVQFENEYRGPAQHLLSLKEIAREAGLDVPVYTRTGWPALTTPMPFGEILPLFGAYAEGFWDRELTSMPGKYWAAFHFATTRTDAAIATEQLGEREARDEADAGRYPYLTCEIGGGMMSSYHRRILIHPNDILAPVLVKLGSGSNSPGYYMYHGGENPEARRGTLQELQASPMTNWNDLPVKAYDFQAPLGQYGQIRPHYHLLRRLHLFLADFGAELAPTTVTLPDRRPAGRDDVETLRWAVRSHGGSGLVFVNNHERGRTLPAHPDTRFELTLPEGGKLAFPSRPVTIPAGAAFFWPIQFNLGQEVRLAWATAQPICSVPAERGARTLFFAALPGVPAEFAFDQQNGLSVEALAGESASADTRTILRNIPTGRGPAILLRLAGGAVFQIVLLDEADSLALWQGPWRGQERAFLTRAGLVVDDRALRLTSSNPADLAVGVYPPVEGSAPDGVFGRITPLRPGPEDPPAVRVERIKDAGPLRTIQLGKIRSPVAESPTDPDFADAAEWRIVLPAGLDLAQDPILRLNYVGDVARVTIGGRLATDDFYNGQPLDVGLRRHADAVAAGAEVRVAILPLQKGAPIFLAPEATPDFGHAASIVALRSVEVMPRYTITVE